MTAVDAIRETGIKVQPRSLRSFVCLLRYITGRDPRTRTSEWAIAMPLFGTWWFRPLEADRGWSRTMPAGRQPLVWSPPIQIALARRWHRLRHWFSLVRGAKS